MKCIKCETGELKKDDYGDMSCNSCGQEIDDYHIDLYTEVLYLRSQKKKLHRALKKIIKNDHYTYDFVSTENVVIAEKALEEVT